MKKSFVFKVFKTFIFSLSILFICQTDTSARFSFYEMNSAAKLTAKSYDFLFRQKIEKSAFLTSRNTLNAADMEKAAFALLNRKRKENNLEALEWSDAVAKIARLHSENMAKYKFFSHRGIDNLMVDDRAEALGIKNWRAIGENIAFNQGYENPVEFAVQRWMLSPAHRENLLNNRWRESAVGVAIADDGAIYFTQVFLLRK